jgi:L,D-transpeptidase YcbB
MKTVHFIMYHCRQNYYALHRPGAVFLYLFVFILLDSSCNNSSQPTANDIVAVPEKMDKRVSERIEEYLNGVMSGKADTNDSTALKQPSLVQDVFKQRKFETLWSKDEQWNKQGNDLFAFIENSRTYGLFPEDYHYKNIQSLRFAFIADSLSKGPRVNAALWTKGELMLTDAFVQIINDIKLGRLMPDSVLQRKDSVINIDLYLTKLNEFTSGAPLTTIAESLEPSHKGYRLLKAGIKGFVDSADFRQFTYVPFPYKDTIKFRRTLQVRLHESGFIDFVKPQADSATLAQAIQKFQRNKGLKADGKPGEPVVRALNNSDKEKFIRLAITLDRYKMMEDKMPAKYIWVNLPSYYLQLIERDSAKITSRVIVGKPATRTPVLTSNINEMVVYPTWTPPQSIIVKEILPAVKRNPGYLARRGFKLVNSRGEEIDPYSVNWAKYSKTIPYHVVQNSSDANALGIFKFNFINKYAVYLHDTNQRYLFGNSSRAMSHGCVRVQEWEKLAYYIIKNDSLNFRLSDTLRVTSDSVRSWLSQKQRKVIPVQNKLPVYLRYFTCEGKNGKIVFYDDIYGEDRLLREKYFANK